MAAVLAPGARRGGRGRATGGRRLHSRLVPACGENDRITFRDPRVAAEAERFAMLRADVTETNDETERWMGSLAIVGVPTIVSSTRTAWKRGRSVGFVEPAKLLALMRDAR